jgi:hypothetical protein
LKGRERPTITQLRKRTFIAETCRVTQTVGTMGFTAFEFQALNETHQNFAPLGMPLLY